MNGIPERRPVDPRHPFWCSPTACEAGHPRKLGDHRSEPIVIEQARPFGEKATVWLSQDINSPLAETEAYVNVRLEQRSANGELELLVVHSFGLVEAGRLGAVMALLARRGEDRTYVAGDAS